MKIANEIFIKPTSELLLTYSKELTAEQVFSKFLVLPSIFLMERL